MPDHRARKFQERRRHPRLMGTGRIRQGRGGEKPRCIAPLDPVGRDAVADRAPRRIAPKRKGTRRRNGYAIHQNSDNCSGASANRARSPALSMSAPGDQLGSEIKGYALRISAPIRARSS